MKQFIKIKTFNYAKDQAVIINTQWITSIAPYGETAFTITVQDSMYVISKDTYKAIVQHMADEIADLTPTKDDKQTDAEDDAHTNVEGRRC